jgi:hypothetical protein
MNPPDSGIGDCHFAHNNAKEIKCKVITNTMKNQLSERGKASLTAWMVC